MYDYLGNCYLSRMKLYMILLGCRPEGRFTEQHDIFFGIGESLKELVPAMQAYWPEGKANLHVDAFREVTRVDGYEVRVVARESASEQRELASGQEAGSERLF